MKFYLRFAAAVIIIAAVIWLLMEFGMGSAPQGTPSTVASAPVVVTPAPTPVPTPVHVAVARPTLPGFIGQAAASTQCTLTGARMQDGWWYVTVVGRDRNALNDFLDHAMRMGLRNLDENYQAYRQFVSNGQQRSQNTYKMRF